VASDDVQRNEQVCDVLDVADRADADADVSELLDGLLVARHEAGAVERQRDVTVRRRRRQVLDPGRVLDADLDTQAELLISVRDHLLRFPLSVAAAGRRTGSAPEPAGHVASGQRCIVHLRTAMVTHPVSSVRCSPSAGQVDRGGTSGSNGGSRVHDLKQRQR
jgi:hypothetical protein